MQNEWKSRVGRYAAARAALICAGLVLSTGVGFAQSATTDAQVESNVLRALASAPELSDQAISTRTVYGTVTLSGSVATEVLRSRAERLASTAAGVKKVVDEMVLTNDASAVGADPQAGMVLQSDGTYAAAGSAAATPGQVAGSPNVPQRNDPDNDQALDAQMEQQQNSQPSTADGSDRRPLNTQSTQGYPQSQYPQQYPSNAANGYPQQPYPPQGYPQTQYPQQGYPQQGNNYPQPAYRAPVYAAPMDGGQIAGQSVIVPAGTLVRVRVDQRLGSDRSQPGDTFQGVVVHDVVAGDAIAIPRGASVQGRVVTAKASGVLKGRGEMSLELTQVMLGGHGYPVVSDQWAHNGGDKTIQTVNRTAGLGAFGAIVGAVAGGGEGAAIGAGVGAAAGLGSSAASGRGQVVIPPEAVITFHLAQPANVQTVSEQEMQRLAYGVPAGGDRRYARPRSYPTPYGAPPAPYGYPY